MTTVQGEKVARRKLGLLQLSQELGNVSKACRIMGYSRQQFYEIRWNFRPGLVDRLPGARGPHPNRVARRSKTPSWPTPSNTPATEHSGWPMNSS